MEQETKMNFCGIVAGLVKRDKQERQDFKHARERAHQQKY